MQQQQQNPALEGTADEVAGECVRVSFGGLLGGGGGGKYILPTKYTPQSQLLLKHKSC